MSEAPHGGQDSRPGENPQAAVGQRDPGTPAVQDAGGAGAGESQPAGEPVRADGGGQQGPGGDSYAWYRRGLDLLSRGSPAAAAELLERAAEAEPGARSIREALARAQFDAGRYAQAADNFRQNVEAIPSATTLTSASALPSLAAGIRRPPRNTSRSPRPCARNWLTTPRRCVASGRRWPRGRRPEPGRRPGRPRTATSLVDRAGHGG